MSLIYEKKQNSIILNDSPLINFKPVALYSPPPRLPSAIKIAFEVPTNGFFPGSRSHATVPLLIKLLFTFIFLFFSDTSEMGPPAKRQMTIEAAMKGKFDQEKARQLWINIFIEGIAPIWLTESPAMREFLAYIAPNFKVPSIVEVEEALRDADAAIQLDLPKSIRCCARMLNVMATTDIREVRFIKFFIEKSHC